MYRTPAHRQAAYRRRANAASRSRSGFAAVFAADMREKTRPYNDERLRLIVLELLDELEVAPDKSSSILRALVPTTR